MTEEVRGSVVSRDLARLALGVSTENLHTTHDPYAAMSNAELAVELQRLRIEPTVQISCRSQP